MKCKHRRMKLDEVYRVACDDCNTTWSRVPAVLRFVRALPREKREYALNQYARQSGV